jgi:acyl transferase domain-containing protein
VSKNSALLFPGQGSYLPGVFAGDAQAQGYIQEILHEADEVAAAAHISPISDLLLKSDAASLDVVLAEHPSRAHLAIFALDLSFHALITKRDGTIPAVLVGHSLGEIAALTAAGALSVRAGATIVVERDKALATVMGASGLLYVRASADDAFSLISLTKSFSTVVAVRNAPRDTVLSGPVEELERIKLIAQALDFHATRLSARYGFHNPALSAAAERFGNAIAATPARVPAQRVYSPILGRHYGPTDDILALIARHLLLPVNFADAIRTLYAAGIDHFLESGAKSVLVDIAARNVVGPEFSAPSKSSAPSKRAVVADVVANVVAEPTAEPVPRQSKREIIVALQAKYAKELKYPVSLLEPDADLEADLGVDSIKATEIFMDLLDDYGLDDGDDVDIASLSTLNSIADYLLAAA